MLCARMLVKTKWNPSMIRTYTELSRLNSFEDRFKYLVLRGEIGAATFGFDRYINQQFYVSAQWKHIRHHVIARDNGCDLGVQGFDIYHRLVIHHMNPMTVEDISHGESRIIDPEYLITTTHRTHNAIHFGNEKLLPQALRDRKRGDTKLW